MGSGGGDLKIGNDIVEIASARGLVLRALCHIYPLRSRGLGISSGNGVKSPGLCVCKGITCFPGCKITDEEGKG